jgi:NADPH:quinone reductase
MTTWLQKLNFYPKARGKHQNNRSLVRPPFTLGLEFAGTVITAPPASGFKAGDRVFGGHTGSYSELITVPASSEPTFHRIPSSWSFGEAAGLAATLPVSYGALVHCGSIQRGETVLIHAAAGGLGIMAVQIAVAVGCRVIGTAGSDDKCDIVKSFGAEACINYSKDGDWWRRVVELTNSAGVDVVFDPVGLVDLSLKCLAHRGRVLVVGFAGRGDTELEKIAMNRVLLKQAKLIGYVGIPMCACTRESWRLPRQTDICMLMVRNIAEVW